MASPTTWNRLSFAVLSLLVVAGFLMTALWYLPEIQRNQALQKQKLELEEQLRRARGLKEQIEFELAELRTNPKAVERVARQQLGYARPGETVIYFVPAPEPVLPLPPETR